MKISEFVEFLNKKIEDHGDMDLTFMVRDYDGGVDEFNFNPEMDCEPMGGTCPGRPNVNALVFYLY